MTAPFPELPMKPPGPQRPSPNPDSTGKIAFQYSKAGIKGETAYQIWGDLSTGKRPLIVLHGGPGAPYYMKPFSLIHTDYDIPVVIYDQIGCGQSTRFTDKKGDATFFTPELFVEELDNVVRWLRREWQVAEFDILGHSWGGKLAALYAFRMQPAGLRKLVICTVTTDTADLIPATAELRKQFPPEVQDILRRSGEGEEVDQQQLREAMAYENGTVTCRCQPWPQELLDGFAAVQENDSVFSTMTGGAMKGSMFNMPRLINGHLHKITRETCPGGILIISGQHDRTMDNSMKRWFTDVRCEVKWLRLGLSSHFVMYEEPEALFNIVGKFLMRS